MVPVARSRAHEVATDGFPTVGFPTIVEVSHPPTRAFEGASGRGRRRSQQRGRVFVAVSYTYLGGGVQPPGSRRLRVQVCIYVWCLASLFMPSGWCAHASKLEVRPFPSGSCTVQCRRSCDVGLLTLLCEHARMSPRWRCVHFFLVWNLHYAVQMLWCDDGCS